MADPKLRTAGKIDPADYKYMYERPDGDPGFDPEHNRRVIAQTIRESDKLRKQKMDAYEESIRERADALASYFMNIEKGGHRSSDPAYDVIRYFGRKNLAQLRGESIMAKLQHRARGMVTHE